MMNGDLFSLSGELRNYIYEYALSEPLGLRCLRGPDGVGRLCLQLKQELMNANSDCYGDKDGKATAWDLDFLGLQRMVRADGRVFTNVEEMPLIDGQIANQLQFVNHELRRETRGLGIRVNSITFTSTQDGDYSVLRQFLDFTKQLPQPQHKHLTTIVLKDRGAQEWAVSLEAVSKFCRNNPRILVKMHKWKASPADMNFVLAALEIKQVYRREPCFVTKITSDPTLQHELLEENRVALGIVSTLPANFRLFPVNDVFEEMNFRQACLDDKEYCDYFENAISGGIDAWIPWIEEWYKNGF
ncbi:hypothetical protein EJ02DRAFT_36333 [Clathrospora elynae]|uniref:Uncharacterized protein n=1 Tax=Clathrospora elynae TaxID=706981 RepID=A0A6A5T0H0_9PLEO|nr:hypothetical protein EJ02DRAFT_36333 [Clathrospora elynae]